MFLCTTLSHNIRVEYEKKRDLKKPKETLEKQIEEDEARLKELKQKEKESKKVDTGVDKELKSLESKVQGIHVNISI